MQAELSRVEREGSPWTGLWAVVAKEMADHLTSVRMLILELLMLLTTLGTVYSVTQDIKQNAAEGSFLFLRLFTLAHDPLPAFVGFLVILIPLIAIALGFDAINREHNQKTMSRLLAQPIYRDALLFGKFLAGLFTLALLLAATWLLVMGLGIVRLGISPSGEEAARSVWFLLVTIAYGGIWLSLAMLFSIIFRQTATSALAGLAVWLFYTLFWGILVRLLTERISPAQSGAPDQLYEQANTELLLSRFSPNTLFGEAVLVLLNPTTRFLDFVFPFQLEGAIRTPLPLSQSLMLIWPHITGMIAATILLFALGYVLFQRQEVRA